MILLEIFSLVPRTLTPAEEQLLNNALEHSSDISQPSHWRTFVANLVQSHSVKVMGLFWKFFEEFDVISDPQLKDVLIRTLKTGIREAITKRPARLEELNDPSLLKYYNEMLPEYEKALRMM